MARIREHLEASSGSVVIVIVGPLEECRVARKQVEVPVFDRHRAPPDLRQESRRIG